MTLGGLVVCSGGLRVARRGTPAPTGATVLRVAPVARVPRPPTPGIEARRSDGVVWRRHWPAGDRLVIEFVDVGLVEVDGTAGTVVFDSPLPNEMEEHLLFDHVLPLVLALRGALVLHGGVISRRDRGAVLVGSSGAGKSTLTAFAWQRGWTVGGDDGAVLHATEPPMAEPTYATLRVTPAAATMLDIDAKNTSTVVGKLRVFGEGFRQEQVELRVVAVLEPAGVDVPARFERLAPIDAHAELFGSTFHAAFSRHRLLPEIVDNLAAIVERTVVGRLFVPRGLAGLASAEALLSELVDAAPGVDAPR